MTDALLTGPAENTQLLVVVLTSAEEKQRHKQMIHTKRPFGKRLKRAFEMRESKLTGD